MIQRIQMPAMRHAEYFQYISSAHDIFGKYDVVRVDLGCLSDELVGLLKTAETAMVFEKRNDKVREKNEADRYRDRLHSKLFNYLKMILYDERDPRFDDAQTVMRVVKEAGNPTRLSENAQSAMMTALGNRLEPLRQPLAAIGAQPIVDDMMAANRQFIAIETEYREMLAAQKLDGAPQSMSAVRKEIDPVFRAIVNAINGYCGIPSKKDAYRELVAEMNVLTARYETMLAARKRERKEKPAATTACAECSQPM